LNSKVIFLFDKPVVLSRWFFVASC
jgi:hypothetical protein